MSTSSATTPLRSNRLLVNGWVNAEARRLLHRNTFTTCINTMAVRHAVVP
jgi:hypothetical protein